MAARPVNHRREVTGVVFLTFSLILGAAYYLPPAATGALGDFLRSLGKGLLGVGAYGVPLLLFYASIDFFFEKRQDVAPRRVISVLFLLLAITAVFPIATVELEPFSQLCLDATQNQPLASKAFAVLWQTGIDPEILRSVQPGSGSLLTGGIIAGGIALGMTSLAARTGALILISAFMLAQIILIFNISLTRTAEVIRDTTKRASGALRTGAGNLRQFSDNLSQRRYESSVLPPESALDVVAETLPIEDLLAASTHTHPGFIDLEGTPTPMNDPYNPYDFDLSAPEKLRPTPPPDPFITLEDPKVHTDFLRSSQEPLPTADAHFVSKVPRFLQGEPEAVMDIEVKVNELEPGENIAASLRRINTDGQALPRSGTAEASSASLTVTVNEEMDFEMVPFQPEIEPSIEAPSSANSLFVEEEDIVIVNSPDKAVENQADSIEEPLVRDREPLQVRVTPSQLSAANKVSYRPAPPSLLKPELQDDSNRSSKAALLAQGKKLEDTLASFGVAAKVINVTHGPAITRFELTPGPGIKVSRIVNLTDDLALAMAAVGVRIEAPIPGKSAIGIEIPNQEITPVTLRSLLDTPAFKKHSSPLVAALGRDIPGNPIFCDLSKMPHLLIAGATGSGKSVCINSILISILCKATPEEVKLLMIDPKVVELSIYNGIPHLLAPVVTDPKKAANTLNWAVGEMTRRYGFFAESSVRDFRGYNEELRRRKEPELPLILIVIDELADLMQVASKEVEESIARLTAMARAAGIHLLIATQRPSVDVITGVIKANIPSRIAFAVSSQVDSRTILDMVGAEKLLGKGDMLYYPQSAAKPQRGQGAFVSDGEVEAVIEFWKQQNADPYDPDTAEAIMSATAKSTQTADSGGDEDELLPQAVEIILQAGCASVSILQRRMNIGYPRAARLIDRMQDKGYIGAFEGSKPRKLLLSESEWLEIKARGGS